MVFLTRGTKTFLIGNDETHKIIYAHQTSKSVKSNNSVMFITQLSLIIFFGKMKLTALVQFVIFLFLQFSKIEKIHFWIDIVNLRLKKPVWIVCECMWILKSYFGHFSNYGFLLFGIISLQIFRGHVCLRLLVVDVT